MNRTLQRLALSTYGMANRLLPMQREPFASIYSRAYFAYKRFAEDVFARLVKSRAELFVGGHIIDAGANIGYTARLFAKAIDPGFAVHAFEPDPANAMMLRRNVRRFSNVIVHQAALGAVPGRTRLWRNRDHPADHRIVTPRFSPPGEIVDVDSLRADDVVPSPVAFVKIDVQGFELEVSRGMEHLLASNARIAVAFEYAPDTMREVGAEPEALLEFYRSRGFVLSVIEGDDIEREAARQGYVDVLATRNV